MGINLKKNKQLCLEETNSWQTILGYFTMAQLHKILIRNKLVKALLNISIATCMYCGTSSSSLDI